MLWLLVVGLIAWVTLLTFRVGALRDRSQWLERKILDLKAQLEGLSRGAVVPPAREPARPSVAASAAPERAEPSPAPEPTAEPIAARAEAPAPLLTPPPPREPAGPPPREQVRAWLEENGLAWAGGAALALGGLFLVTYAAQRGMFTPPLRIAAAIATGAILLGASEWLKRRSGHPLAAALAAGAGAATLYGAVWASYWLYAFIGFASAGALLGVISLGLLALAFRHGAPLAVIAILGGFLAPAITGPEQWTAPALTAYLGLITVTGYVVTALRGWGPAGLATLAGAFAWAFAGFEAKGYARVTALTVTPFLLSLAAVEWRRRRGEAAVADGPATSFTLLPTAALAAAALALSVFWLAPMEGGALHAAGVGAALLALLAAVGARRGLVPPLLQVLGYLPALAFVVLYVRSAGQGDLREAWGAGLAAMLIVAGVVSATGRTDPTSRFSAAVAALVALVLAITLRGPLSADAPWLPSAGASALLLAAVVLIVRRTERPQTDLPLALWIWAAAASAIYALTQGFNAPALPVAAAVLSLAAAVAHARLGWRGFAGAMLAAAIASLSALISPALFDEVADGRFPWWGLGAVAAGGAAFVYGGSRIARRGDRPPQSAEAQSTAALLIALTGAALLLRHAATAGAAEGGRLDLFLEAGLRTVLILAAGLTSAQAVRADSSLIGRWRGQVMLAAGLAHGLFFQVLVLNPLWAWWKPAVVGPPLLDSLAVGLLVPAALLAAATWKRFSINRGLLATYALGAAALLIAWAFLETRRLFQGASLEGGFDMVGRAEAAAYAALALLIARAVIWLGEASGRRSWTVTPFAREIVGIGQGGAWVALASALFVFGYAASPWWGPIDRPLAGVRATALLFGLYVAGGAAAFILAGPVARAEAVLLARAARMTVVAVAFALLSLAVRLAFRGYDMRPDLRDAGLETWTFSAAWGLFGFGLLVYGAARRNNDLRGAGLAVLGVTLAKIFLFDMARLDGVVRAGSFLAVGALLLTAAVLVRRLSGAPPFGKSRPAQTPEA
jgi:uncharacterized membrane protein